MICAKTLADHARRASADMTGIVHLLRCMQESAEATELSGSRIGADWYRPGLDVLLHRLSEVSLWLEDRAEDAERLGFGVPEGVPLAPRAPPATDCNPDAELIEICAVHDALQRAFDALNELAIDDEKADRLSSPILREMEAIVPRIVEIRAVTREGWRARAVTLALNSPHLLNATRKDSGFDDMMLAALLRDMTTTDPSCA